MTFEASNGVTITIEEDGYRLLREFFRAEEDERLGRWRWLNDNDYVIYDLGGGLLRIMRESDAVTWQIGREENAGLNLDTGGVHSVHYAARAYFDAHPAVASQPWHDAEAGEVWVLTVAEIGESAYVSGDFAFRAADHAIDMTSDRIIAGRCISREGN